MAAKTLHSPMSNQLTGTVREMQSELSRVPVVTHIITDEDIGLLQVSTLHIILFLLLKNVFQMLG